MAHYQQIEFVRRIKKNFPEYFQNKRVLEIGSWDTNGTIRNIFEDCDYVGVDVSPGPGVDVVRLGNEVDLPTESFDVVISCECFEHNPFWVETFINMIRMLKKGGLCLITCATTGRIEHGTTRSNPLDSLANIENILSYYRNLDEADIRNSVDVDLHFDEYFFSVNRYHCDLFFLGLKRDTSLTCKEHKKRLVKSKLMADEITKNPPPTVRDRILSLFRLHRNKWIKIIFGEQLIHELRHKLGNLKS